LSPYFSKLFSFKCTKYMKIQQISEKFELMTTDFNQKIIDSWPLDILDTPHKRS
ncbi:unnamed protein product, partial [Didymodactylos carnosus]